MAKIADLPVEILQQIFEHFVQDANVLEDGFMPYHDDMELENVLAIRAVSQTCRTFYQATAPIIWRSIYFNSRHYDEFDSDCPCPYKTVPQVKTRHVLTLLRLWHARPDIAAHVRNIEISWSNIYQGPQHISSKDIELLTNISQDVGFRVADWRKHTRNTALVVGLSILLAKKLRYLHMYIAGTRESRLPLERLPAPEDTPVLLESLQHLNFSFTSSEPRQHNAPPRLGMPVDVVGPLMKLAPNLRRFHAVTTCPSIGDIDWSGLTSITFGACVLTASELVKIIRSCRGLEEFNLASRTPQRLPPGEIISALKQQASTLRELEVAFGQWPFYHLPDQDSQYHYFVPSLAKLINVKMLSIGRHELIGHGDKCILRTLPQSVVHLEVPCEPESREDFEVFADLIRAGHYPNLQEVQLPVYSCRTHDWDDRKCPARFVFAGEGDLIGFMPMKEAITRGLAAGDPADYDWSDDDDCDRGKTLWRIRQLLVDAGVKCWIYGPNPHEMYYPY